MDDHCPDDNGHESSTDEEGISVLEGGAGWELKDEVVVDPLILPHEQIAPVHEQVQAQQRKHAEKIRLHY